MAPTEPISAERRAASRAFFRLAPLELPRNDGSLLITKRTHLSASVSAFDNRLPHVNIALRPTAPVRTGRSGGLCQVESPVLTGASPCPMP